MASGGPGPVWKHDGPWLTALLLLAAFTRLYDLGGLSLWGTEDYVVLAARSLLEDGTTRLPSGVAYPRAVPMSYLVAGIGGVLGVGEWSARLPSALASTLGVGVVFAFGRRMFGLPVAVLAGLVMALSGWEIVTGRMARMYAPLSATVLVAVWLVYRVVYLDETRHRVACLLCLALAGSLHQIAAAFALPIAALLFLRETAPRYRVFLCLCAAVLVTATAIGWLYEQRHYGKWVELTAAREQAAVPDQADPERFDPADHFVLLADAGERSGLGPAGLAALALVLAAAAAFGARASLGGGPLFGVSAFLVLAAIGVHQSMAALYAAVGFGCLAFFGAESDGTRKTACLLAAVGVGGALWLACGMTSPLELPGRVVLRSMVGYPTNFLLHYLARYPLMCLVALWGCVEILRAYRVGTPGSSARLYLVALLVLPPTLLGFHPTAQERFFERYAFYAGPYFILLYAWGLVRLGKGAVSWLRARGFAADRAAWAGAVATLVMLFATGGIDPVEAFAATRQHHGRNEHVRDSYGARQLYPDNRSVSVLACDRAAEGDLIVASDILAHVTYCPRVDYQFTTSRKGDAEGWVGVRSIHDPGALVAALLSTGAQRAWLVISSQELRLRKKAGDLDALEALLAAPCAEPVYEAVDGSTVTLLERSCWVELAGA